MPVCTEKIRGVVTNTETGLPIAGATVDIGTPQPATTAADGSYSFDQVSLGENNSPVDVGVRANSDPPVFAHIGSFWEGTGDGVVVCNQTTVVNLALVPVFIPPRSPGSTSSAIPTRPTIRT